MPLAPERYCRHLTEERYHPRSNKAGDFLAQAVLADILNASPQIRQAAADRKIAFALNYDVQLVDLQSQPSLPVTAFKDLSWNIDLALGPPAREFAPKKPKKGKKRLVSPDQIAEGNLGEVWMMLDAKGVMTEHGKARRNRQRDVTALWAVMHTFHRDAVVGAVIPINIASRFRSPTRTGISKHKNIDRIVDETLAVFRAVRRKTKEVADGIEGVACFVVDYSNMKGAKAKLHTAAPAPKPDDPIRYENFLKSIVGQIEERFGKKMG